MAYTFDWVDAFTTRPFGGNACVVVHGAEGLSLEQRLALVKETSLSECAYLVGSDVADFGACYYVAHQEILMAGHPTIATVVSLLDRGLVPLKNGRAEFTLEVGAGVLPITVADGMITMTQPAPVFGQTHDPAEIAALYGLTPKDIIGVPQTVSTGTPFCIAVLRSKDALRRAKLDLDRLDEEQRVEFGENLSVLLDSDHQNRRLQEHVDRVVGFQSALPEEVNADGDEKLLNGPQLDGEQKIDQSEIDALFD